MLPIHNHVKPNFGARGVVAPLEKQRNGVQRVHKRVAPRMADEPRRLPHVLPRVALHHELACNAAAAACSSRLDHSLTHLLNSQATQPATKRALQPCKEQHSNALHHRVKNARSCEAARTSETKPWLSSAAAGACCSCLMQPPHTVYPAQQFATLHASHCDVSGPCVAALVWHTRHVSGCCAGKQPLQLLSAKATRGWPLAH